jgi:hypothetical protein
MAQRLDIDNASILDNVDERQVEFAASVDDEEYQFAVQYSVLEALSGDVPEGDAVELFNRFVDPVSDASLAALGRDADQAMIVVSENDLD